jgi:hypothetical protein
MNNNLTCIQLSGIVKPGEIYLLKEDGFDLGDAENLYTIKADEEIIRALDMEVNIVCRACWTFRTFLGIKQLSEDSHLIRLLCYDKQQEKEIAIPYALYRIKSFQEELANMKELFECK